MEHYDRDAKGMGVPRLDADANPFLAHLHHNDVAGPDRSKRLTHDLLSRELYPTPTLHVTGHTERVDPLTVEARRDPLDEWPIVMV